MICFGLAAGGFIYALVLLSRREDLLAVLSLACAGLALHALRRSLQLLDGT